VSSGAFLAPLQASAGLLSLFSKEANAEVYVATEARDNSQTMALLSPNLATIPVFKSTKAKENKEEVVDPNETISIMAENALVAVATPKSKDGKADILDTGDGELPVDQISVYVVREGDTIAAIAEMYDVSSNTILWANDLKKGQKLVTGDTLIILPVSGVKHVVVKGQTLQTLAKLYKVEVSEITEFNGLDSDSKLAVGDELIIPDGILAPDIAPKKAPGKSGTKNIITGVVKNAAGYFINPVPGLKRKSQGLHNNNRAVDLAASIGTPIYASASGRVIIARNGYNGGYGNMIIIEHPNGTKTLYAHLNKILTSTGSNVSQGELIGHVGNTGRSTGPHLHFEVHNAKNPGADWSWKY
jgi:LysM repeat protein